MSEFDVDLFEGEEWDELDATVDELEELVESEGNWARPNTDRVPPAYQEINIPGMLEHHVRIIVLFLGIALGGMLKDWVKHLRSRSMLRGRELVQDVGEICSMAWSATRSDGAPDDESVAVKWLAWAESNGLVSKEQLANAYWLAELHGSAGTNTPEDAMRLGMSRKLGALGNRPAPTGSEAITVTHGDPDPETGLKPVEIVDTTFEISQSEVKNPGRISSIRISDRMPKGDARRDLFWVKFIEGKSRKFWVGEANTERALFKLIQDLEPKVTGRFTLRAGKVDIRVSSNPKAPALLTVPAAELLRVLANLEDRWGNLRDEGLASMYQLALKIHGAKTIPEWATQLSTAADKELGTLISCIRGRVEDFHLEVWGAVVDAWRELLGIKPPPAGPQLPGFTITCRQCHKPAGSLYVDGLCHACHRSANPL